MKYFIDFEFTSSAQIDVDVVCVAIKSEDKEKLTFWLHRDDEAKKVFRNFMTKLEGHTLIAYAALAECRALRSLGIDPMKYEWIDLYVEWRQLKNHNNRFNFGRVKNKDGHVIESKSYNIQSTSHQETGYSLSNCVLRLLNVDIDYKFKNEMRDLILSRSEAGSYFLQEERNSVLDYCASDIEYLDGILSKFIHFYKTFFGVDRLSIMNKRGKYIAALSKCEHIGTPIDLTVLSNISLCYDDILGDLYRSMNERFELYVQTSEHRFTFKNILFAKLVEKLGIIDEWPRTSTDNFSTDAETIEKFRHYKEIELFYQTKKTVSSLRTIKGESKDKLLNRIGNDGRLRSYFGPFGTQTGRNAPKAGSFVLAMSNWLRVLISPPKGELITAIDYSSQEFAIAASLSGDQNMKEAYRSGDPYLYFAKKAGAIPADGTKAEFQNERNLFKSTTLGLQYGMGVKSLARKLTQDLRRIVTDEEATELIELHQRVYPTFWMWTEQCWLKYLREGGLETTDGWVLFGDNQNSLSVKNFMIQGTGASIMRQAVIMATEDGLNVMAPLHDAIYIIHSDNDKESPIKLAECMTLASRHYVDIEIRLDTKTITSTEPWVEDKGRSDYEKFNKYLRR